LHHNNGDCFETRIHRIDMTDAVCMAQHVFWNGFIIVDQSLGPRNQQSMVSWAFQKLTDFSRISINVRTGSTPAFIRLLG
jgi:hypothetical protein